MTLEEKRDFIRDNRSAVVTSLNTTLDRIYDLIEPTLNDKGNVMTANFKSQNAEKLALLLKDDIPKYEELRTKILSGDFELNLTEINEVAICCNFCKVFIENYIAKYSKSIERYQNLFENLTS